MEDFNRTLFRVEDGGKRWCGVEIRIRGTGAMSELSVSGIAGYVCSYRQAKREAFEYWVGFFEDMPEEIAGMNKRCGSKCRNANGAARFVLATDGELHGLDVHKEDGKTVYVTTCGGQIWDEMREFFPEIAPLEAWHLNELRSTCEHQEAELKSYETHPGDVCAVCGWKLGDGWCTRKLPDHIVVLARTIAPDHAV